MVQAVDLNILVHQFPHSVNSPHCAGDRLGRLENAKRLLIFNLSDAEIGLLIRGESFIKRIVHKMALDNMGSSKIFRTVVPFYVVSCILLCSHGHLLAISSFLLHQWSTHSCSEYSMGG